MWNGHVTRHDDGGCETGEDGFFQDPAKHLIDSNLKKNELKITVYYYNYL